MSTEPYVMCPASYFDGKGPSGYGVIIRRGDKSAEMYGILPPGDQTAAYLGMFDAVLRFAAKRPSDPVVIVVGALPLCPLAGNPAMEQEPFVTRTAREHLDVANRDRASGCRIEVWIDAGGSAEDRAKASQLAYQATTLAVAKVGEP